MTFLEVPELMNVCLSDKLREFPDYFEELTDESNVCDDDDISPALLVAQGFSLALPTLEDEFGISEDGCQSPGLELKLYDIESLPPQAPEHRGKLTVVFDLDETLVHAREGTIRPRPFVTELLKLIQGRCEPLVWTASVKSYAERVITALDTDRVIKQCICRTDSWFPTFGPFSHAKDLRLLGRDLSRTIIIENTPDCVVTNPLHSIIVPDYNKEDPADTILRTISRILDGLIESPLAVPQYLATCSSLRLETLRNPSGETLSVFMA